MTTYPVRINRKMAEEWAERLLDREGLPVVAGYHYCTIDDMAGFIKFLKQDMELYRDEQMYDLLAASKRQLAIFEKSLAHFTAVA